MAQSNNKVSRIKKNKKNKGKKIIISLFGDNGNILNITSKDSNEIKFLKLKQELFKLEKTGEIEDQSSQNEHQMKKNDLQIQLVQLKANIQKSKFQQDQFKNLLI
ncbi:hypothetical protein RhiirB3_433121 [Rhizophagus irregularis]|nr:hypothetical protein RhiirB3_433121 [Rhizophagus irregularis]